MHSTSLLLPVPCECVSMCVCFYCDCELFIQHSEVQTMSTCNFAAHNFLVYCKDTLKIENSQQNFIAQSFGFCYLFLMKHVQVLQELAHHLVLLLYHA